MTKERGFNEVGIFLFSLAAFIVIVAGMKAASSLIVPFLMAIFISTICMPPLYWLRRKGVPNTLAVIIILVALLVIVGVLMTILGTSLAGFSSNLPYYEEVLLKKSAFFIDWLNKQGMDISTGTFTKHFDPNSVMNLAANTFAEVSNVLTNIVMIMLTVIFILFEASEFPKKIYAAVKNPDKSLSDFDKIAKSVNHYLAIKTLVSLAAGALITLWLWIMGVDYPLLWGVLAFLMNYIPNIGSIIAGVPVILLSLIQFGAWHALLIAAVYYAIDGVIGGIIEPRVMGRGLGLSTLVVFLSLVFWGWVLGPIGMFLSVPLTMILKIVMEGDKNTRWFAILIGPRPQKAK